MITTQPTATGSAAKEEEEAPRAKHTAGASAKPEGPARQPHEVEGDKAKPGVRKPGERWGEKEDAAKKEPEKTSEEREVEAELNAILKRGPSTSHQPLGSVCALPSPAPRPPSLRSLLKSIFVHHAEDMMCEQSSSSPKLTAPTRKRRKPCSRGTASRPRLSSSSWTSTRWARGCRTSLSAARAGAPCPTCWSTASASVAATTWRPSTRRGSWRTRSAAWRESGSPRSSP